MNYFEHHIGDYDQATAHLSACEDGIYSRLIRRYYASEKPLPADIPALQRLVRAHSREEKKAVQTVLAEFFDLREDGYHQHRCDEGIDLYRSKQAKARASAEARWGAQRAQSERNANASPNDDAPGMRTHMHPHCEGNAPRARPQSPSTNPQAPDTNLQSQGNNAPSATVGAAQPDEPPVADAPATRGTRLPADWSLPKSWGDWTLDELPGWSASDVRTEAAKFADFWHAKAGKDATKLDWLATWRNWCRNAKPQRNAPQSTADRNAEARRLLGIEPENA